MTVNDAPIGTIVTLLGLNSDGLGRLQTVDALLEARGLGAEHTEWTGAAATSGGVSIANTNNWLIGQAEHEGVPDFLEVQLATLGNGQLQVARYTGSAPTLTFRGVYTLPTQTSAGRVTFTKADLVAAGLPSLAVGDWLSIITPSGGPTLLRRAISGSEPTPAYFRGNATLVSVGSSLTFTTLAGQIFKGRFGYKVAGLQIDSSQLAPSLEGRIERVESGLFYRPAPTEFVIFLIAGQSNALGMGDSSLAETITTTIAYQYYAGVLTTVTADPIGAASTGSAWAAFANEFFNRTGLGVIFVPTAVGGTPLLAAAATGNGDWSSTGTLRGTSMTQLAAAKAAATTAGLAWQFGGILWAQGETDASGITAGTAGVTKANYKTEFASLLSYFQTQTGLGAKMPMLIARVGRLVSSDTTGMQQIRAAQEELVKENPGVHMAFTGALNFYTRSLMNTSDGVHYLQQGYNEMGHAMGVRAAAVCLTSV